MCARNVWIIWGNKDCVAKVATLDRQRHPHAHNDIQSKTNGVNCGVCACWYNSSVQSVQSRGMCLSDGITLSSNVCQGNFIFTRTKRLLCKSSDSFLSQSFNVKGNGDETPLHHWVLGNFGQEPCMVCRKDCGKTKSLDGWRCAWCKRSVKKNGCGYVRVNR